MPQLDEREAKAVRGVFERRGRGDSTGSIANWMNSSGFRTRKGRMFTGHAIKDMLNTRFYLGTIRYRDDEYAGQHKPITSATWNTNLLAWRTSRPLS